MTLAPPTSNLSETAYRCVAVVVAVAVESIGGVTGAGAGAGAAAGAFVSSTGAASFAPPPHAAAIKTMASAAEMRVIFMIFSRRECP